MTVLNGKYERLKQCILRLGAAIPGTIRKVYLKCGKENCYCMDADKNDRHGPYLFWDRKVNGRLSSLSISKKDLKYYESCIENRKELEKIIDEILDIGMQVAVKFGKKSSTKFKKIRSSTRGK